MVQWIEVTRHGERCARSRYQGQGQVIAYHSICGIWSLVPALNTRYRREISLARLGQLVSEKFFESTKKLILKLAAGSPVLGHLPTFYYKF